MYTLNAVKLRNQLLALDPTLKVELKNVRINGVLQGCTGFVTDEKGTVVYVNTDRNHGTRGDALYRLARDTKDYTGGRNRYADWDSLAPAVSGLMIMRGMSILGYLD